MNRWEVHYEHQEDLELVGIDEKLIYRVYRYAMQHDLYRTQRKKVLGLEVEDRIITFTPELIEKAKYWRTPQELEHVKKKIQQLQNKLKNIEKEVFVGLVHLDPENIQYGADFSFSDCPPYCDDCVWREYIVTPYWKDVKHLCPKFTVENYRGKIYTYYEPTDEALKILKQKYQDKIQTKRQEIEKGIKELQKILEYNNLK